MILRLVRHLIFKFRLTLGEGNLKRKIFTLNLIFNQIYLKTIQSGILLLLETNLESLQ